MAHSPVNPGILTAAPRPRVWTSRAFGLNLEADLPVLGFSEGECGEEQPDVWLKQVRADSIDTAWPSSVAERLIDRRHLDGSAIMTVDAHPEQGYRIDAPGHGRFRVSADGSSIECAPAAAAPWRWHRPLVAQALPLAAALNGMELLHASGVVIDGAAIAVVGHSGAGKTSLAIHLMDQGAVPLTDDVLSLSISDGVLLAHPGVRFSNVAREQVEALPPSRRRQLGTLVGSSEKLHILVNRMAATPAPLGALYFLERDDSMTELRFERLRPPAPRTLLSAAFLAHATTPSRMRAQLEVHSLIAASVPTFRLMVPSALGAARLARLVAAHSRTGLAA